MSASEASRVAGQREKKEELLEIMGVDEDLVLQ